MKHPQAFFNNIAVFYGDVKVIASRTSKRTLLVPETTAYSWWNCQMSSTSANCCQLIPQRGKQQQQQRTLLTTILLSTFLIC